MNSFYKQNRQDDAKMLYHKPLMVKFPDKCEWQNRFIPELNIEWAWSGTRVQDQDQWDVQIGLEKGA